MLEHIELFFKSIFIDNMVFATFLGMCSYLAVSKKVSTAVGLGAAVIFVLAVTVPINWLLDQYILRDGALAWLGPEYADYDLSFLSFILFIATIATMVQLVEIVVEKFSPSLYNSLGIFLPLIAVNCAILGGSLFMQSRDIQTLGLAFNYGISSGIGWFLAILAIAAIREKIRYSNVPAPLRGLGITFIITGLMAIGFMSFGGMLTGGDEEEAAPATDAAQIELQEENTQPVAMIEVEIANEKRKLIMLLAASMSGVVIATIAAFLVLTLILVGLLLFTKQKLSPSGPVTITINGEKEVEVASGGTLLSTLGNNKIFLPSACGGGGTCIQCECHVLEGGGEALPTETPHFSRKELAHGARLACQVKVKQNMNITIPEEVFGIKKWEATVVRNYNVASFIKEFVVEIPEDMGYKAGGYIQIEIPECTINYKDIDITAHPEEHETPDKFQAEWDKFGLWPLTMKNNETVERAYSMASFPAEGREIMLNVRIATPPWDRAKNQWMDVNPGVASSYIFAQKPGDKVVISGPYGEFFINESEAEMLYVGGGAGMAPMRSHLYHLFKTLKTGRTVTYWYGGRSKRELFYLEHFRELEREFPNFKFYLALSEPMEEDNWKVKDSTDGEGDGFVGFIHQVVIDQYLSKHESPEDIELYFCGPPLMNNAVQKMGEDYGIPDENIRFDDFGG